MWFRDIGRVQININCHQNDRLALNSGNALQKSDVVLHQNYREPIVNALPTFKAVSTPL